MLPVAAVLGGCGGGATKGPIALPVFPSSGSQPADLADPIMTRDQMHQRSAWTILVYLDADNDLEAAGLVNLNQMEAIGSTKDVHVLVQVDRIPGYDSTNGDWTDTRRFMATRDADTQNITSLRLDSPALGELDMGDWHTLRDFVQWGISESPSDNYCLVIWDHGTGWQFRQAAALPQHKYIALDATTYSSMNVTDIPKALAGTNLTVIAFDACLMQQIEVAYELKDCVNYMVGSATVEPSPGYNYYYWISEITANTTPAQLCKIIVDKYAAAYPQPRKAITQSALDLSKIDQLAAAAGAFAEILLKNAGYASAAQSARESCLNYSTADGSPNRCYVDLVDYAELCTTVIGSSASAALTELRNATSAAVIAEVHNSDTAQARGLGIYVPPPQLFDSRYATLRFAADTTWDEWLRAQAR